MTITKRQWKSKMLFVNDWWAGGVLADDFVQRCRRDPHLSGYEPSETRAMVIDFTWTTQPTSFLAHVCAHRQQVELENASCISRLMIRLYFLSVSCREFGVVCWRNRDAVVEMRSQNKLLSIVFSFLFILLRKKSVTVWIQHRHGFQYLKAELFLITTRGLAPLVAQSCPVV